MESPADQCVALDAEVAHACAPIDSRRTYQGKTGPQWAERVNATGPDGAAPSGSSGASCEVKTTKPTYGRSVTTTRADAHAQRLCRCGHTRAAHDHLRRGSDCATCPADGCTTFRAVPRWSIRALLPHPVTPESIDANPTEHQVPVRPRPPVPTSGHD